MSTRTSDARPLYAITKTTLLSQPTPPHRRREGGGGGGEEQKEDQITSTQIYAVYADREAANRAGRALLREVAARAGRLGPHGNLLGVYGESMGADFMYFGELLWAGQGRRVEVKVLRVWGYL